MLWQPLSRLLPLLCDKLFDIRSYSCGIRWGDKIGTISLNYHVLGSLVTSTYTVFGAVGMVISQAQMGLVLVTVGHISVALFTTSSNVSLRMATSGLRATTPNVREVSQFRGVLVSQWC